jgi:hypothetical protein
MSNLSTILQNLRSQIVSTSSLPNEKVVILAGDPEFDRARRFKFEEEGVNLPLLTLGDNLIMLVPSDFNVDKQIQGGAGRYALYFEGVIKVYCIARLYTDISYQDSTRLTHASLGVIQMASKVMNGLEQYYPQVDGKHLFANPLATSKLQFLPTVKGYAQASAELSITWLQDLS